LSKKRSKNEQDRTNDTIRLGVVEDVAHDLLDHPGEVLVVDLEGQRHGAVEPVPENLWVRGLGVGGGDVAAEEGGVFAQAVPVAQVAGVCG